MQQLAQNRYGRSLKVGDEFSGMGYIPLAAAELVCDVHAYDLNPVAGLLTWGALNIVGGSKQILEQIDFERKRIYKKTNTWLLKNGLETSEEG